MHQSIKRVLAVLTAILVGVSVFAQVTTSSLNGKVADEMGEPLAGAAVVAVHTPTGTQYYAAANTEGRFNINGMRAGGPYTVEISYVGMASVLYNDVTLKLGEPYELDVTMKATNELDAVTVVAEKSFNASITGAGSSFSLKQVETMPTINRSIYDVVKYTPQANVNKNGGISFSGSNNRYNSFQIDGAVANDSFGLAGSGTNGGQTGANPISLDAIEEVQVVIAPFDVRQSGFTGGAINAITKSGTNKVKGSFYSRYYNQDFIGTTAGTPEQMKQYFNQTERTKYSDQATQNYGFTVGGPIVKNKLFMFLSTDYNHSTYPTVYAPSEDSYGNKALAKDVIWNGKNYGKIFNSEMAAAMLEKYQQTYGTGLDEKFSETFDRHQKTDRSYNIMSRIDWNINDANKLMLRYQYADSYADQYSSGASSYTFNNSSYKQVNKTNTIVAELNSRISDIMSNELRATAVLVRDHRDPGYKGATMYIRDNITVNLGTEYSSGANAMNSDTYTLTDNFSIFAGNHNITVGTHNEFFKFNNVFLQYAYGEYVFATVNDFFNDNPNQFYYNYADPEYTGGETIWAATTKAAELGVYVQDEWKPTKNFTLTYGVRADAPMLLNKPIENQDFNSTELAQKYGEYVGTTPKVQPLWSPRVGFRWYIDDAHKSLLRGGAGLFTGRVPFVWLSNAYNNTGVATKSTSISKDLNRLYTNGLGTSNPYTYVQNGILTAGASGLTINTMNKNFKYPQVARVNLGFDQEFAGGWKLTFDGIFSKTLNNVFFHNLVIASDNVVYPVSKEASEANPGSTAPYYHNVSDGKYSTVVALGNTSKGYTYSLSGQVSKSFDFGLDLMASYTFGHSYSVNDGTSSVAYSNWKYNYSIDTNSGDEVSWSLFDKPHKVSALAAYTSPSYFAGRASTTVTLSYTAGSGQRYSYTMRESSATVDFNGDGYAGNSLLYIPTTEELTQMSWADAESAQQFENLIRSDRYLSSHRGEWSQRYAGIAPWEHHFDLHVAENIFYDKQRSRKLEVTFDVLNVGNLLNRAWGIYYGSAYNRQVLNVSSLAKDGSGDVTPTYSYYSNNVNTPSISDFSSRWRCQLGVRLTF